MAPGPADYFAPLPGLIKSRGNVTPSTVWFRRPSAMSPRGMGAQLLESPQLLPPGDLSVERTFRPAHPPPPAALAVERTFRPLRLLPPRPPSGGMNVPSGQAPPSPATFRWNERFFHTGPLPSRGHIRGFPSSFLQDNWGALRARRSRVTRRWHLPATSLRSRASSRALGTSRPLRSGSGARRLPSGSACTCPVPRCRWPRLR